MYTRLFTINFLLYIATFITAVHNVLGIKSCTVCHEGQSCEFVYTFNTSNQETMQFTWKIGSHEISNCYSNGDAKCLVYPIYKKFFSSSISVDDSSISLTLVLKNVSRNAVSDVSIEGVWKISILKNLTTLPEYSCVLNIYKNPNETFCKYFDTSEGLQLQCETLVSYPEYKCKFRVKKDNKTIPDLPEPNYNSTIIQTNPVYYRSKCYLIIPKQQNLTGHFEYDILVFPNLVEENESYVLGIHNINSFRIEKPEVILDNCNEYVVEGTRFNCLCKKTDHSDITTQAIWYHNNIILQYADNESRLTTEISLNYSNYTCSAESKFSSGNSVEYNPDVFSKDGLRNKHLNCPENRPHVCLPTGQCYGNDEFCTGGKVESCFPENIEESNLLSWCILKGQYNVSLMKSAKCNVACVSHFGALMRKSVRSEKKHCPQKNPNDCGVHCYSDDEFCLGGNVFSCLNGSSELVEWCRSNDTVHRKTDSCRTACLLKENGVSEEDESSNHNNRMSWIIILIVVLLAVGVLVAVLFIMKRRNTSCLAHTKSYSTQSTTIAEENTKGKRDLTRNKKMDQVMHSKDSGITESLISIPLDIINTE